MSQGRSVGRPVPEAAPEPVRGRVHAGAPASGARAATPATGARTSALPRGLVLLALAATVSAGALSAAPQPQPAAAAPRSYPELPSEIPATFTPVTDRFDHERRSVDIPMRDGVKLHTVILVPRGAKRAPILLTRTPYDAAAMTSKAESANLGPNLAGYDHPTDVILDGGYIRVVQDVRGKHGSEGDYVMNRPLRGPLNPTPVDHATDTWDTIDWLVKNVPESNGRVGILGISYNGFLSLMALVDPHPALRVAVPQNPMVDGWIGDDWFHRGAFRQQGMSFIYDQQGTRKNETLWWSDVYDEYDQFLRAGSAGELGRQRGLEQTGFWRQILLHPTYDAYWQQQAVDKLLGRLPLRVPTMIVHGTWDQEDIYGAPAVYAELEPKDTRNDLVFLVIGPWYHGQQIREGSALGPIRFGEDTALTFRRDILAPFLAQHLIEGAPAADVAPVTAFETGSNRWRRLPAWPACAAAGCEIRPTPIYLRAGSRLAWVPPTAGEGSFEEYVADPAKPVPFIPRPVRASGQTWREWLVTDQREAASRTDVATFVSEVLREPVQIAGPPRVQLVASTSGTDGDWVVKLIDVYPDEIAHEPAMGGYQLMVAADIFRGRYRESYEHPRPLPADQPFTLQFPLPHANHVFRPGHRIMVQVQSSWFPLYDRNPQTYVESIFWAKPEDYRKATQRIWHAAAGEVPGHAGPLTSAIELPLVVVTPGSR
jgi:putative CocE/NonD family hydrolase